MSGLLAPEKKESILGLVQIRQCLRYRKLVWLPVAMFLRELLKRFISQILRDNVVIHEGELDTLKRFKDDVNEVKSGFECGLSINSYSDIKVNDQLEVFEVIEVKRTL